MDRTALTMPEHFLALFCAYGSSLDAGAAVKQKRIYDQLPVEAQDRVRYIQDQERAHAVTQHLISQELCPELHVNSPYLTAFHRAYGRPDQNVVFDAAWLCIAEKMYLYSFRSIARRARQLGHPEIYHALMQIGDDEAIHVEHGVANVQILGGVTPEIVRWIGHRLDALNESDEVVSTIIPQGLKLLPLSPLGSICAERLLPRLVTRG